MFGKNNKKTEKVPENNEVVIQKDIDPKDLWEPAKPGETLDDVWIPNRKERRRMMKDRNKNKRSMNKLLRKAESHVRKNPDFKQDLYKALYENLLKKTANIEEELKKKNENENKETEENGTTEGN